MSLIKRNCVTNRWNICNYVYGSWVTHRQYAKIAYFKGKGVSDK